MRSRSAFAVLIAMLGAVLVAALAPSAALGVTREAVLRRGEQWIAVKVPYSQSAYANESGTKVSGSTLGWRTDCSGFVSMCLGLTTSAGAPRSLDTATLPAVLQKITKADLKPGDIILRPKNATINGQTVPYGHAVVFVRWVDAAKTKYVGYHESSSQKGTVASEIGYPFWGEAGFAPYRYTKIEDVRMRKSRQWLGGLQMTIKVDLLSIAPVSVLTTVAYPSAGTTPPAAPAQ